MRLRRVSGLERIWLAADRISPPFVNQLVLEGRGHLSTAALQAAVHEAAEANPGLRAGVEGIVGAGWWTDCSTVSVHQVDGTAWGGMDGQGASFLERRLSARGPTAEVLLVDGDVPRVVIRTHHAIADGRGTWAFAEDVFSCLRGEPAVGAEASTRDIDIARRLGGQRESEPPPDRASPLGPCETPGLGTHWERVRLEVPPRPVLPRLLFALRAAAASNHLRLGVSVDLRRHASDLRTTSNLTGIVRLELDNLESWQCIDEALRAALAEQRELGIVAASEPLRWLPLAWMERIGRRHALRSQATNQWPVSMTVSNLGRQPVERLCAPTWDTRHAWWIPPGSPGQPLFVAVSGDASGIDLVATCPSPLRAALAPFLQQVGVVLTTTDGFP